RAETYRLRMWLTAISMSLLSAIALVADSCGLLSGFRTRLHDSLSPGRLLLVSLGNVGDAADGSVERAEGQHARKNISDETANDGIELQYQQSEMQRRQLLLENARLRNQLRQQAMLQQVDDLVTTNSAGFDTRGTNSSLHRFLVTPARVISSRGLADSLRDLIVDAGKVAGVTRSELIVDGSGWLLDKGTDYQVSAGDRVLAGAVVVGRVAQTARWVSLVQPVTDPEFSARVQLMRTSSQGQFFGAEGILTGSQGPSDSGVDANGECEIHGIPYTEAVSVGDDVVSADINGTNGPRLYFGRVSRAEFLQGGQWSIRVRPAVASLQLDDVGIVRLDLNLPAPGSGEEAKP
ncbi:MAG: hypothetical protein KDA91_07065, partial [Planctomycetaceae bacterium]|nr:hypothetical protein [Planctomycetaceae bacterium]